MTSKRHIPIEPAAEALRFKRDVAALRAQPLRTGPDVWPTPACLARLLVNHVLPRLPRGRIWECAAGPGVLTRAMQSAGRRVVSTDIGTGSDFLTTPPPRGTVAVVTNPPYNSLNPFLGRICELLDGGQIEAGVLLLRWDHPMAAGRAEALMRASYVDLGCWRPVWLAASTATGRWAFAWHTWLRDRHGPPVTHYHQPSGR